MPSDRSTGRRVGGRCLQNAQGERGTALLLLNRETRCRCSGREEQRWGRQRTASSLQGGPWAGALEAAQSQEQHSRGTTSDQAGKQSETLFQRRKLPRWPL